MSQPPRCPGAAEAASGALPSPEQLSSWLSDVVDRDGLHAVIQALMQAVGRESLLSAVQQACDLRMGPEPVVVGLAGAQVGLLPTSQASCRLRHDRREFLDRPQP